MMRSIIILTMFWILLSDSLVAQAESPLDPNDYPCVNGDLQTVQFIHQLIDPNWQCPPEPDALSQAVSNYAVMHWLQPNDPNVLVVRSRVWFESTEGIIYRSRSWREPVCIHEVQGDRYLEFIPARWTFFNAGIPKLIRAEYNVWMDRKNWNDFLRQLDTAP